MISSGSSVAKKCEASRGVLRSSRSSKMKATSLWFNIDILSITFTPLSLHIVPKIGFFVLLRSRFAF